MNMKITKLEGDFCSLAVSDGQGHSHVIFDTVNKTLSIQYEEGLSLFLLENEEQFRRMLANQDPDSRQVGFSLDFSIIDGKDVQAYNDKENIVVRDHGEIRVITDKEKRNIPEVYTDASCDGDLKRAACSILKKDIFGRYDEHQFISECKDPTGAELDAVLKALEIYGGDIRIMTDSQYVRKGITEWMLHWKHNGWKTASGSKAKNISMWKRLEKLCEKRYVEFGYVKAHSNNFENDYCDLTAREKRISID